jgi:8-oxo-dGTP diphosphatase / 2-hydroxy-dATP diphosphatase
MNKVYTLVMIEKDGQILLGMKKRGFGAGWWNGFGGKVNLGESIEQAAKREVEEEVGLKISDLKPRGILFFTFEGEEPVHEAYLFESHGFSGEPLESDEMKPVWFKLSEIPYDKMWPADKIWLPLYLEGKDINGTFNFTKDKQVGSYNLN